MSLKKAMKKYGEECKTSCEALEPADKRGWLVKQGGSVKTWKKRWCILKGKTLYYYTSQKDTFFVGKVDLEPKSMVREEPAKKKPNLFSISTSKRVFYMYPDNPGAMREWIQAMTGAIAVAAGGPAPSAAAGAGAAAVTAAPPGGAAAAAQPAATPAAGTPAVAGEPAAGQPAAGQPAAEQPAAAGGEPGAAAAATPAAAAEPAAQPAAAGGEPAQPAATGGEPVAAATPAAGAAPVAAAAGGEASVRQKLANAKSHVPFLNDEDSKVLEFWQIWQESIPTREELVKGNPCDFRLAVSADLQKLTWRVSGPQNAFIQKMVDFFWNVGAPESEIDRLNDVGAEINPVRIGSWIDMSNKGGMDGGWYFPVTITLEKQIASADPGDAATAFQAWCEANGVTHGLSVGRDMGAAPPRQTELRIDLPGETYDEQIAKGLDAYSTFGFPPIADNILAIMKNPENATNPGCVLSVITSSEGFVRCGILCPKPPTSTCVALLGAVSGNADAIATMEAAIGATGPEYVEYQHLMRGFGYGVYREDFDVVFHYSVGQEDGA